jgi:hypothetical protein
MLKKTFLGEIGMYSFRSNEKNWKVKVKGQE